MSGEFLDSKFKRKRIKIIERQQEFNVMQKRPSRDAMARFREEPFQLRYQRMREENEKNAKV